VLHLKYIFSLSELNVAIMGNWEKYTHAGSSRVEVVISPSYYVFLALSRLGLTPSLVLSASLT